MKKDPVLATLQKLADGELSANHFHIEELIRRGYIRFDKPWTITITSAGRAALRFPLYSNVEIKG